jgi:hypothetical protein
MSSLKSKGFRLYKQISLGKCQPDIVFRPAISKESKERLKAQQNSIDETTGPKASKFSSVWLAVDDAPPISQKCS